MGKKRVHRSSGSKTTSSIVAYLLVIIASFFLAASTMSAFGIPLATTSAPVSTTIKEILENPDNYLGLTVSVEGYLTTVCPETGIGCAVYLSDDEGNMIETYGPSPVGLPIGERVRAVGQVTLDRNLEKVLLHIEAIYQSGQTVYQSAGGGETITVTQTVTTTKTVTVTISGTTTTKEVTLPAEGSGRGASLSILLASPAFLAIWAIYAIIGIAIVTVATRS